MQLLAVDQKFLKKVESSNNGIFGFKKVSIYCQILIKVSIYCQKLSKMIKSFNLLPKIAFDLLPNLRENFDLLF
jgi:hypothetical protein